MGSIAVINYGMGNLCSIEKALSKIGAKHKITKRREDLRDASHIILPGVGSFAQGMINLSEMGFIDSLRQEILGKKKPLLGICLGMQLLFEKSEEGCEKSGLGFIKGEVTRFRFKNQLSLKVPHIGWNKTFSNGQKPLDLLQGIPDDTYFYFVHSYHVPTDCKCLKSYTNYGYDFVSIVQNQNIFGTQFHPEKSQKMGSMILSNFINWGD